MGELVKEGILEAPLDGNHGEKHPTSDEYVDSGIPFLMASDIHNGEVNIYSCKYITKERAERLDKGFARNGDVLLTHKATIGETAILSNLMTEYAMLTPQVTYYRIKNEERLNREYLYSFFNSLDFQTELKTKAAQSTRPYIGITAQQNLKIILPAEIDEQIRIGLYFRNLDHLITLHQRKCDQTKNLKKYMLQKMFPQNGAKVPEIRFDGYTYDWEQRKFGSLLEETRNKTIFEDEDTLLSCAIDGMYLNSELFSHFRGSSNIGYLKVKKNDLILSAQNLHLGNCNVNLRFEHGIISPAYKVYELVGCNPLFMQAWVKKDSTKDFFLKSSTEGASVCRKNIVWEELYKQELPVPSIEEQTKVGEYFYSLDHLITLHQRKCDELKKMKKYMLQNMFI